MSPPPSSFPADASHASRSRWPWLLAAGPAVVVVASLATAWIAFTRGDSVVAADYYKLGLTINRRLAASPARVDDPSGTLTVDRDGAVRLRLDAPSAAPARVTISLRHPGQREGTGPLSLARAGDREWTGSLQESDAGRRIVAIESDVWRLPITVIDRLPATIRVGAVTTAIASPRETAQR